jgi:hypothetical protein
VVIIHLVDSLNEFNPLTSATLKFSSQRSYWQMAAYPASRKIPYSDHDKAFSEYAKSISALTPRKKRHFDITGTRFVCSKGCAVKGTRTWDIRTRTATV